MLRNGANRAKRVAIFAILTLFMSLYLTDIHGENHAYAATQATYYVSPTGSDSNAGSIDQPFATIAHARDAIRTINSNMTGDIIVYLRGGSYTQTSTIQFSSSDSGTNGYNIIYKAYPGESPMISGGTTLTGWTLSDPTKNIYKAYVGTSVQTRQLFVNGVRAIRARGDANPSGFVITATGYTAPASGTYSNMSSWGNKSDIEMNFAGYPWMFSECGIASISGNMITMKQPCWDNSSTNRQSVSWVENAYELLDSPREWYLDRTSGYMYYIPSSGEDLSTATVIAPTVETLVDLSGVSTTNPVHHIQFDGVTFAYATWLQPSGNEGYADAQGGEPFVGTPGVSRTISVGNVLLSYANNCIIQNSTFEYMGGLALLVKGTSQDVSIIGNKFSDNSHTAIGIGVRKSAEPVTNFTVKDNFMSNIGVDYWGGVGIAINSSGGSVDHNEIFNVPYSGITVYGPGNLSITNNLIYNHMQKLADGGGIYTNSVGGNSTNVTIANNFVHDQASLFGGIYLDDFSRGVNVHDNVVNNSPYSFLFKNSAHTISNNYMDTGMENQCYDGSCTVTNNTMVNNGSWPLSAYLIMDHSGLETAYSDMNLNPAVTNPILVNRATSKLITSDTMVTNSAYVTDNQISKAGNYASLGAGLHYAQIDLGAAYNVNRLKVWRDYGDGRAYHDVIMQVSNDPSFSTGVTTVFNNDTDNSAGKGTGVDAEYAETSAGKFVVFNPVTARYVRIWSNGNSIDTTNRYVEIKVYSLPDVNLARGTTPTFSATANAQNIAYATDGQTNNSNFYTDIAAGAQWMQIDMGQEHNINKLKVWHYYANGRTYHDVIMQLSNDPHFGTGVTTVFNNDSDNSAGQGTGTDGEYSETSAGREISFNSVHARYVRLWSNGSTTNTSNHYVEVEVYGQ